MIKAWHPEVADSILLLMHQDGPPSLMAASRAAGELRGVSGFDPPSWQDLANGARPPYHDLDDQEPGVVRHGWQHEAASRVERDVRERRLMPFCAHRVDRLQAWHSAPPLPASSPALIRICFGCCFCVVYVSLCPSRRVPQLGVGASRVRSGKRCRSNLPRRGSQSHRQHDGEGHNARDARRLEIVADGLPLFGGVQLAVDTTLVSPLHCDDSTANMDGAVLAVARHKKETTYPELTGPKARCRLVVLAGETGGRWSEETRTFVLSSWPRP